MHAANNPDFGLTPDQRWLRSMAHDLATTDLAATDDQAHNLTGLLADLGRRIADTQADPHARRSRDSGSYRRIGAVVHTATRTLQQSTQNAADHITVTCPLQVVPLLSDGHRLCWTLNGTIAAYDVPDLYCGVRFGDNSAHDSAQIGKPSSVGVHSYAYDVAERIGTATVEGGTGHRFYTAFILDPGYSVRRDGTRWHLTEPAAGHPLQITHAGTTRGIRPSPDSIAYTVTYQGRHIGQVAAPAGGPGYRGALRAAEMLVFGDGGIVH